MNTAPVNAGHDDHLFRAIFEQAAVGMAIVSPAGQWVRVNGRLCDMLGYSSDELLALTCWEITHPDDREADRQLAEKLLGGEIADYRREKRYLRKDGSTVWVRLTISLSRGADGQPDHLVFMVEDISARVAAEKRLQLITDGLPVLVAYVDTEQRYRFVNQAYERWFGCPAAEIVGRHVRELLGETGYLAARPYVERVLAGEQVSFETGFAYPDGRRRSLWVVYVPDREGAQVRGFIALVSDITELRQAESALHLKSAAVTHSRSGVAMSDLEGRLLYVNPTFLHLWGYAEESEVIGRLATDFWGDPAAAGEVISAMLKDGQWTGELEAVRKDGSHFSAELSGTLIRDPQGQPMHFLGSFIDVTDRRQLQVRLQQAQRIARVGSWELDIPADRLVWSEETYRIFGVQPDRFAGTYAAFLGAVHPDDRERVDGAYRESLAKRVPYAMTHRICTPDGQVKWVHERGETLFAADGAPLRSVGAVQDISERVQGEEALRVAGQLLDSIVENIPAMIFLKRADDLRFELINLAGERLLGHRRGELIGRNDQDFFPPEQADFFTAKDREVLAASGVVDIAEETIDTPDGPRILHTRKVALRDARGQPIHLLGISEDITERKRVEAQMHAANQVMNAVLDTTPVLIAYLDPAMNFVRVNRAYAEAGGRAPADFVGRNHFDLYPHAENEAIFRRVVATGQPYTVYAKPFEHPDAPGRGTTYWDWTLTPVKDVAGRVTGLVLSLLEVSARIRALESTRNSEARLAEAQRIAHVGSWELDLVQDGLTWSDEIFRIFEIDKTRFAASYDAFLAAVHPDDREAVNQAYMDSLSSRQPYEITHRLQMPDGRIKHVTERCETWYDERGKPLRSAGTVQDVTERVLAMQALQHSRMALASLNATLEERVAVRTAELEGERNFISKVLDTAGALVVVLDVNGRVLRFNRACETATGFRIDELRDRPFWERLIPEEERDGVRQVFERLHATALPSRHENHWLTRDGGRRLIAWSNSVVTDDNGQTQYVIGTGIDITDRKAAEEALLQAKEDAERASRAKSEFLSRMSHELRTPMNAILGFSQVLELDALPADQLECVREIHKAGDHLLELINELLDLSRIEAGKLAVAIETVDLDASLQSAQQLVQGVLQQNEIALVNLCAPGVQVLGDAMRLRQVLVNLLSNAAKYNRRGGRITVECRPHPGDRICLRITDTGQGIAADKVAKLFTPFERLGAEFGAIDGTGIGLALCRELMHLMGGEIGVESRPGDGSTFWIALPVACPDAPSVPPHAGVEDIAARIPGAGRRVLYVEDNAANLRLMEAIFRALPGWFLITATTGEHGVDLARRQQPDLIVLDVQLPGMDGFAVLDALRSHADTRDIPAIALSADAMPADVARGMAAGFLAYLTKPVSLAELKRTLDSVAAVPPGRGVAPV